MLSIEKLRFSIYIVKGLKDFACASDRPEITTHSNSDR
jgi:hypothetical protein